MPPTEADRSMEQFDFRRIVPSGELGSLVESVWYARGVVSYRREQVAPTGSTVAAVVLGDPIRQQAANGRGEEFLATTGFLVGPHDEPMINAPTGETHAVGIVTTPIGCRPVLGLAPSDVSGRVVDLESWWSPAVELRAMVIDGIDRGDDPSALLAATEAFVVEHCAPGFGDDPALERIGRAVAMVEADPLRPIADVASAVGLSHGHLDEEFARLVGLSPRALSRLLRVRRVLEELNGSPADVVWSDLAVRHGWYDQAHMSRDFKRHTGVSPTVYVARRREAYVGVDPEPGFVPDPPDGT